MPLRSGQAVRMRDRILVTGAGGFVGQVLCDALLNRGDRVTALQRTPSQRNERDATAWRCHVLADIAQASGCGNVLSDVKVVVHLAARVHMMNDDAKTALAAYRQANLTGTENLARAAAAQGVKRFIFLSSIKVNGEQTTENPFRETDPPHPQDSYAVSKWEAEQALMRISAETGMEVAILRPPLVYGPRVRANFLRLLRWVDQGVPLPLAAVRNRRSMIYLGNLVDAIVTCIEHPAVAGRTYLLSDGEDVSTPDLIRRIAVALGRTPRLWPLPVGGLRALGALTGRGAEIDRLLQSLQVDSGRFHREAGWQPPFTLSQGVGQTVDWYREAFGQ